MIVTVVAFPDIICKLQYYIKNIVNWWGNFNIEKMWSMTENKDNIFYLFNILIDAVQLQQSKTYTLVL